MSKSPRPKDPDLAARIARLTPGQRACLDLVDEHATSKEIARQLGISRHTVDARLRQAMQILGVATRREAAILWRAAQEGYQPFAYQSSRLAQAGTMGDEPGHEARLAADGAEDTGGSEPPHPGTYPQLPAQGGTQPRVADAAVWTWPTVPPTAGDLRTRAPLRLWGGVNDLSPGQRLAGILVVTLLAMLAFGVLLSGMAALTQLRS